MPPENSESNGHLRCNLLIIYHVKILAFVKKFNAVMREESFVCTVFFSTHVGGQVGNIDWLVNECLVSQLPL